MTRIHSRISVRVGDKKYAYRAACGRLVKFQKSFLTLNTKDVTCGSCAMTRPFMEKDSKRRDRKRP